VLLGAWRVAKKDSPMSGEMRARVLTGTGAEVRASGAAELACEEGVPLANAAASLGQSGEAEFPAAAFAAGSAGKIVHLRARLRVESALGAEVLTSEERVAAVKTQNGREFLLSCFHLLFARFRRLQRVSGQQRSVV
jgi:hypothetical protein